MSALPNGAFSGSLPFLSDQFLFDEDIVYFNHGSFGACPRPVFEAYQRWQRELERQPVEFIQRRLEDLLAEARARLGAYAGASPDRLVFVPNATYGVNVVVARSLKLAGDEVLGTNHEPSVQQHLALRMPGPRRSLRHHARQGMPLNSADQFVDALWAGVTERTPSPFRTSLRPRPDLPHQARHRRPPARQALLPSSTAHTPRTIDLALDELGADYYTGNAHKWLYARQRGSLPRRRRAGISARTARRQPRLEQRAQQFAPLRQLQLDRHDGPVRLSQRARCHRLQTENDWPAVRRLPRPGERTADAIQDITGLEPICPDSAEWYSQMFVARLPLDRLERLATTCGRAAASRSRRSARWRGLPRISIQAWLARRRTLRRRPERVAARQHGQSSVTSHKSHVK